MRFRDLASVLFLLSSATTFGCSTSTEVDDAEGDDAPITSNEAQIVDFNFDAEVVAAKTEETRKAIVSQLFYTIGALTTEHEANGQVGRVELSNVTTTNAGDLVTIKYHARLPVAWPKGRSVPRRYDVVLPKDTTKLQDFNAKYDGKCGANEYGRESFWHDFNPKARGCAVDPADVSKATARVTKSRAITQNKYPEYDRVWEDGALEVVAIFGFAEGGGASDVGQQEYEEFVRRAKDLVPNAAQKENARSASIAKDVSITGKVRVQGQDKDVRVTALLIDSLYTTGPDFAARYEPLSEKADLVVYNGHSELSKNTNALARMGKVAPKRYQLFFFDSCDTYAYLDTKLAERRTEVNGAAEDPKGTKYLDVATNVLPSYFVNYAGSSLSVFKALLQRDTPKTYNEILAELPSDQVVVVTGEEDNAFRP
jgi:hypothetical protein